MSRVLPILFNTEMVRAILEGRKTVTRRVIKRDITNKCDVDTDGTLLCYEDEYGDHIPPEKLCQYQPGDILYVRETWTTHYVPDEEGQPKLEYCYKADGIDIKGECLPGENNCWRPSIHMPKEAARIWLKVTDVRAERLCSDIREIDCIKEGISPYKSDMTEKTEIEIEYEFEDLWNSTIKKSDYHLYGFDADPWVWVIEFECCEKPEVTKIDG